ncbi:hypothetical protein TeGR_g10296, partial [Tetraparma gracilis]
MTSSVKLGLGGKTNFSHDFEVTAASPLSVRFRHHPDAAPAPHDASGTLTMVGAEHNTTRLSMAAQMAAAGEGAPAAVNVLSAKEAHALLDDLLLLLPALFAMFERSAEVDEAVLGQLTERFQTASTEPSADEVALLDKARTYNEKAWNRTRGSVREPVEKWRASAGETSAWGKAVGSVDAAAARVLAYLWHIESYERLNAKSSNPIKLGLDIPNSHSMFQLVELNIGAGQKRFCACKWTWCRESSEDFFVAVTSVQDLSEGEEKAAIMETIKKTKSSEAVVLSELRLFYRLRPLAENVCEVTLVGQGVIGGWVPDQAMKFLIGKVLGSVDVMRDKYERNGKVVDAELRGDVALGMAKATLDCSTKEALANYFAVCGREYMRRSREEGNPAQFVFEEYTNHDIEWVYVAKMPFPLTNREFLGRYLCFKEPAGDLVLVFEALPDSTKVDYGANLKVVRAKSTGVMRFKSINDDTQCEVTLVQYGDFGGFVPERVVVAKIPQALSGVADMRELFQRDDAIDGAKRSELMAIINTSKQPYMPDEDKLIDDVGAKFESLTDVAFEKLDSPDHFVRMSSSFKEESSNIVLRATM